MVHVLFESPFLLSLLLLIAFLVLGGIHSRWRSQASSTALAIGILSTPLLFMMQHWVETDREKLESTVRQLARWTEAKQVQKIIGLVDPLAEFGGARGRQDFEDQLTHLLQRYSVERPSVSGFDIQMDVSKAVVRCNTRCTIRTDEWTHTISSKWELTFTLQNQQWLIVDLRPIEIAGQAYKTLWDIQ